MNTRIIAAEYRLAHWAGIIREKQASGLSIRAYCETSGIHENTYYYWQRKLRESACLGLEPGTENEAGLCAIPSGWALCKPMAGSQQNAGAMASAIEIEIGKSRVKIAATAGKEMIAAILQALVSLC